MIRICAWALIAISAFHLTMFTYEARDLIAGWATGGLWSDDHWLPFLEQPAMLAANLNAYWATAGGFAAPLILIGCLLLWMDRRGVTPPAFIGWGLLAWSLLNAAIIEISGFPVVVLIAVGLVAGSRKAPGEARPDARR